MSVECDKNIWKRTTDIKCRGCGLDLPESEFNWKLQRPSWLAIWRGSEILDWVCIECWDKGIRYKSIDELKALSKSP